MNICVRLPTCHTVNKEKHRGQQKRWRDNGGVGSKVEWGLGWQPDQTKTASSSVSFPTLPPPTTVTIPGVINKVLEGLYRTSPPSNGA